ncbi:MAG: leucine--tRNA ligase [Patescibacteria group bacterium]
MDKYIHQEIEAKWQKYWAKEKINQAPKSPQKKKYILDMFPYPSAAGLHVGHPEGYTATDIYSRYLRLNGYDVLHPMGWDAFGLPAENFAIKQKVHPQITTDKSVETFRRQIQSLGLSYDWSREIKTSDPAYYKWTQWFFLLLYKNGLAYKKKAKVNWCNSCQTVLANEQVVAGQCERCHNEVVQKDLEQWFFKVTQYADRLLNDLDTIDWPEPIKLMQKNWIGRSEGAELEFAVRGSLSAVREPVKIKVFTTRPDTLFGVTYMVLAPEHGLINNLKLAIKNWEEVEQYIKLAQKKNEIERTDLAKAKTGVELKGIRAINPATNKEIPIFVADYVLTGYGTGAIMAVPAHDERDYEFAKKFSLPIIEVIKPESLMAASPIESGMASPGAYGHLSSDLAYKCWVGTGTMINSGEFDGLTSEEAKKKITQKVGGQLKTQYKLRDWLVSRQRYWGAPIPMIYCDHCAQKKPKVLLTHGLNAHANDNWFPWLKEQLENSGYEVLIPILPNASVPTIAEWVAALQSLNFKKEDKIFIVAHSLSAPAVCQYIQVTGLPIEKLILVAPTGPSQSEENWSNMRTAGAEVNSIEAAKHFNQAKIDLVRVKKLAKEIVIYLSDNDPYIPLAVEKDYQPLGARVRIFNNRGHSNRRVGMLSFPEILEEFSLGSNSGLVPVPEKDLPVLLPDDVDFKPTGESPLVNSKKFHNVKCPVCGAPAKRESDTMDTFVCSSWYYFRYTDPENKKEFASQKEINKWLPVDLYVGGAEHAVLHLMYARFFTKVLYDLGYINFAEPFLKLRNQGMILGEDGQKMSKSRGNVINPDDVVRDFGADSMRLYEMFMGPLEDTKPWSTKGINGVRRFLDKVWLLQEKVTSSKVQGDKLVHQTIKKVTEDIENMRYNTAISAMMILVNGFQEAKEVSQENLELFLKILAPFSPHLAEELWQTLGHQKSIFCQSWPKYDPELVKEEEITLVIQINGKMRTNIQVKADISETEAKELVLVDTKVKSYLTGKEIVKVIFVPGRLINIVVK